MKQISITLILTLISVTFSFGQDLITPTGPTTSIEFEEIEFDWGTITHGEKVSTVFVFTNTGDEPLVIKDAKGSCGCTVPTWPKELILPGEKGEIKVVFNSKGKSGSQNKRVTITTNTTPAQTFLNVMGEVIKEEKTLFIVDSEPVTEKPKKTIINTDPKKITTTIEFEETVFDWGTITEGEKVSYVFIFTNTGDEALVIKDAKGSCGCTVPQWSKEPIAPGEQGEMKVVFNSKGKSGMQNKRVTLTANTNPGQTFINVKGEIIKQEKENTFIDESILATPEKIEINTDWKKPSTKDCFAIFPNPTTDILKLEMKDHLGKSANIMIFNSIGTQMTSKVIDEISDEIIQFEVNHYIAGTYYVNIQIGKEAVSTKCFVVAKN